jgi:hypothetical protein
MKLLVKFLVAWRAARFWAFNPRTIEKAIEDDAPLSERDLEPIDRLLREANRVRRRERAEQGEALLRTGRREGPRKVFLTGQLRLSQGLMRLRTREERTS